MILTLTVSVKIYNENEMKKYKLICKTGKYNIGSRSVDLRFCLKRTQKYSFQE